MVLFEEYAAVLLPIHAIFALLTVALSTHLALWLRKYCRGQYGKRRATLRFAVLSTSAYAITMCLGMALYPTYKVRVRAEYLENPSRIHRDTEQEAKSRKMTRDQDIEVRRYRSAASEGPGDGTDETAEQPAEDVATRADAKVERAAKLIRWFDVKEHWAVLGLLLSCAVCGILLAWKPDKGSASIAKAVTAMAVGAAGIAWAAALIGLMTAAARSVIAL
jgi:hypothetical protein